MRIEYDPEADALYIYLRMVEPHHNVDIEEGVSVDLDGDGHIVGIEILDASKRMTRQELASISYENLLLAAVPEE